jgi:hypothetical protein
LIPLFICGALASARDSLCRGLGSRWFTERFHNLAVDGTGASIAAPNALYIGGIVYEDSAGTVSYVSARNQTYEGYGGIGISALTTASAAQTVTIEDSFVRGFDRIGIYAQLVLGR